MYWPSYRRAMQEVARGLGSTHKQPSKKVSETFSSGHSMGPQQKRGGEVGGGDRRKEVFQNCYHKFITLPIPSWWSIDRPPSTLHIRDKPSVKGMGEKFARRRWKIQGWEKWLGLEGLFTGEGKVMYSCQEHGECVEGPACLPMWSGLRKYPICTHHPLPFGPIWVHM